MTPANYLQRTSLFIKESSEQAATRLRWLSFVQSFLEKRLGLVIFCIAMIAHLPFIFGRFIPYESLAYFSADENGLISIIMRYQGHIDRGDWGALSSERLEYGYGYLFYVLNAFLTYPFYQFGGDLGVLAAGRSICAILESASVLLICLMLRRIGVSTLFVLLVGIAMALTPGLIVMHKPLSAEQYSNFLIVLAAFVALFLTSHKFRRGLFIVSVLVGAAISLKLNAALAGSFFALVVLFYVFKYRFSSDIQKLGNIAVYRTVGLDFAVIIAGLSTFFLFNLPILVSEASWDSYLMWIERQFASNATSHAGRTPYAGMIAWWPRINEYFGALNLLPYVLGSACVASVLGAFFAKSRQVAAFSALSLVWVLIPSLYVLFSVTKIWLWYLFLPGLMLLAGPACLHAIGTHLFDNKRPIFGISLMAFSVALIGIYIQAAWPDYSRFAKHRFAESQRADFVEIENIKIQVMADISQRGLKPDGLQIVTDPYTTLPLRRWRAGGAKVRRILAAELTYEIIAEDKPDYLIARFLTFAQIRGDREGTRKRVQEHVDRLCAEQQICYEKMIDGPASYTVVFRRP